MRRGRLEDLDLPADVRAAVAEFIERLGHAHVEAVVLYGSAARGEYGPESDVDLLVFWDGAESAARDLLAEASCDVLDHHGVLVNAFPMDGPHRRRIAVMDTRFHRAVQEEGILVER